MIGVGPNVYAAFDLPAGNSIRRPCACRLDIVAIADADGIQIAMQAHQQTRLHRLYVETMTRTGRYEPLPARNESSQNVRKR